MFSFIRCSFNGSLSCLRPLPPPPPNVLPENAPVGNVASRSDTVYTRAFWWHVMLQAEMKKVARTGKERTLETALPQALGDNPPLFWTFIVTFSRASLSFSGSPKVAPVIRGRLHPKKETGEIEARRYFSPQ